MAVDCCAVLWFVAAANKMTSCGGESASGHKAGGCGGKRSCVEFCGQTAHAQHHTLRVDACNTSVQNTKHTCTCGTMLDSRTGVFCVGVGMIYVHSRLLGACGCCLAGSARIAVSSPAVGVTSILSIPRRPVKKAYVSPRGLLGSPVPSDRISPPRARHNTPASLRWRF